MNVDALRVKHPNFIYESFDLTRERTSLTITFTFSLEPDIVFRPTVTLPVSPELSPVEVNSVAFHLGMAESISYWKAACSPNLIIKAGRLTDDQINWWHDLFIHGLGEFFFRNVIDFTRPDFLTIRSLPRAPVFDKINVPSLSGDLVMVGGGKDSIVTLETLRIPPGRRNVFMLNPTPAAEIVAKTAGYENPLVVRRTIDPALIELNKQNYLNGHTPFSAYLAFLGIIVAAMHGYRQVITSNEQSAAEGNVLFHGLEVNHQYSKSFRFEKRFRKYAAAYLNPEIGYFSFLRPLYELQIAKLFTAYIAKYPRFLSCNVNKGTSWCGQCPKCAFVYLSLFPFLPHAQLMNIFGNNFFESKKIQQYITELVGLGANKPFDCVGTKKESIMAVILCINKYTRLGQEIPEFFRKLADRLRLTQFDNPHQIELSLASDWVNDNYLPDAYARLLKNKLSNI